MNNRLFVVANHEHDGLCEVDIINDECLILAILELLNCSEERLSKNRLTLGNSNKEYIVFLVGKLEEHDQMSPDLLDIDDSEENYTKGTKTLFVEADRYVICNEKNGKLESITEADMENIKRNTGIVYREDLNYPDPVPCDVIRIRV
ncbi:hypothetical protein [Lactobacillus apis]|uniref:Uncharacterized protein n=1 Tax=Lactobacillus apis TaxID=303541 RepID=A0A0F4LN13_9LACO|nr:hypothetical protein [Lactobacillus apis]KJY59698.1 hypothetical protein JF72_15380 [Lactobacillus apis]